MAASIRCYFGTINQKQSSFCTTYSFKTVVSEPKGKNNLKKNDILQFSYIVYNVYCNVLPRNAVVLPRF